MDPILAEIYSTVLGAAPYVVAAYALIFVVLAVYVAFVVTGLRKTEKRLQALEEYAREHEREAAR